MTEDGRQSDAFVNSTLERLVEQALHDPTSIGEGSVTPDAAVAKLLMSESYTGSFPHPNVLRGFNEVVPNGAERAFALTELEQKHRHETDNIVIKAEVKDMERAATDRRMIIVFIFLFVAAAWSASFYAAYVNKPLAAGVAGVFGLAGGIAGLVKLAPRRRGDDQT